MVRVADTDFVRRRLSEMAEALGYMRRVLEEGEEEFARDFRSRLALRHLVLMVVESAASIALHILAEDFGERADSYSEAFTKLSYRGVLSPKVASEMASLARLGNLIVHRYWLVDDLRIYREAKGSGLLVVEGFIREVRRYVEGG